MIYVIRHGQTDWNLENRFQGQSNIDINEKGFMQANETKEKLSNIKFDKVYSSPLKRAYTTAKIISNNKIILDYRLKERYNGDLEGKDKSLYKNKINFYILEENTLGIEPFSEYKQRIYSFMDEITKNYNDENILIVTHSVVSVMIKCYFDGNPLDNDYNSYKLGNAEIAKYDIIKRER